MGSLNHHNLLLLFLSPLIRTSIKSEAFLNSHSDKREAPLFSTPRELKPSMENGGEEDDRASRCKRITRESDATKNGAATKLQALRLVEDLSLPSVSSSLSLSLSSIMSPFFPSKSSNASSASSSTKPRSLYRCGEKKVFKFDVLLPLLRMLIVPLGAQTSRLLAVIFWISRFFSRTPLFFSLPGACMHSNRQWQNSYQNLFPFLNASAPPMSAVVYCLLSCHYILCPLHIEMCVMSDDHSLSPRILGPYFSVTF